MEQAEGTGKDAEAASKDAIVQVKSGEFQLGAVGTELPQLEDIPTMEACIPHYGFGEAIKNARTLVIRNVKMPKTNGGGDNDDVFESPIYKTSFISGDEPMIDLGSGKMALVDGKTGQQIVNVDIGDWENDDDALKLIAELIADQ